MSKNLSVRDHVPQRLAENEKERLFASLETFINLDNGLQDLANFRTQCPNFWPLEIYTPPDQTWLGLSDRLHDVVIGFRDALQHLWQGGPSSEFALEIVLGLNFDTWFGGNPTELMFFSRRALEELRRLGSHAIHKASLIPDWNAGDFLYLPVNDFQRAVRLLMKENWRAKTCAQCARYFIAAKPARIYCSSGCYGKAKRARGLRWWTAHGRAWRKRRARKQWTESKRHKKSHRKGGK